jgi:Acyl-CoA reductase (LuxC)
VEDLPGPADLAAGIGAARRRRYGAVVPVHARETAGIELDARRLRTAMQAAVRAAVRLRSRPAGQVLATLDRVIVAWLQADSPWRQRAEHLLPSATGFSSEMIRHGLPRLLEPLRADAVRALLDEELGNHSVLDAPWHGRRASGLPLITHVLSGNIPGLAATSMVLSLAVKSAALVKSATDDQVFPMLFADSMRAVDDELAECLVVTHWRGGDAAMEEVAFGTADLVVASGSDATIAAIARRAGSRFIGHGHKVSFAAIGRECLSTEESAHALARRLAYDVSVWDQHGCLSPQLCYLEADGAVSPEQFARLLADALQHFARELPPHALSLDEKAAVLQFRQATEWNAAYELLASPGTDWTISIESDADFLPSCLNRCVRLKVVSSLTDLAQTLAPQRRRLEAVGLAVGGERIATITALLAANGVHRICPLGTMQSPTLRWRQSGRPRVAEWMEWTEVEEGAA